MSERAAADDRERRLIEAVVSLARTFRVERDRLARRLTELEREIEALAFRVEAQHEPAAASPAGAPPAPSRTPS